MGDNPVTPGTDNPATATETPAAPSGDFSWKSGLSADVMNSPTLQKFEDTRDGLGKAVESHLSLEKLLGHEKVPIPKGDDDAEGWSRFSKAMGIPDKAEAYGLPDAEVPESMKSMSFDKGKFAETVHAFKLTPNQAKGLWGAYTDMTKEIYANAVKDQEPKMTEVVNQMRAEWGDAYDTNVQLGQLVINKFSGDQDTENFVTATLSKDPRGIKFLSKIGGQFAENKIGDFGYQRFSLAPEEAQEEIDKMTRDLDGPYMNQSNKFTDAEHQRAMDRYNSLLKSINKAQG